VGWRVGSRCGSGPSRVVCLGGGEEAGHGRKEEATGHRRKGTVRIGTLEYGNIGQGVRRATHHSTIPSFHYSIVPPPEASAGGRLFGLSAHARRAAWRWTGDGWRGGVMGGRGRDPSPEPPLRLGLGSGDSEGRVHPCESVSEEDRRTGPRP